MRIGILFSADQSKGGVFQYSISFINSLKKNKKIKKINIYTNNKNLAVKGCNVYPIKNYRFIFLLSIISGMLNFYPKILFSENEIIFAPSYSPLLFFQNQSLFLLYMIYKRYISQSILKQNIILLKRKFRS